MKGEARRWDKEGKNLMDFLKVCEIREGKNAISLYLMRPNLVLAGYYPDWLVDLATQSVMLWTAKVITFRRGDGIKCLNCDVEFSRDSLPPCAFLVAMPYLVGPHTKSQSAAVVSGICQSCARRSDEDLLRRAKSLWQEMDPSIVEIPAPGHG